MKKIQATSSTPAMKPDVIPMEGDLLRAVHALAAGFRVRTTAWPAEDDEERPVYDTGTRLARDIVAAALGAGDAAARLAGAADDHYARARELADDLPPLDDVVPTDLELGTATAALREQSLEHHTTGVMLGTREDRGLVLVASAATPAQAHAWLLGPLYEKLEGWAARDPLTSLERAACAWWFSRWRGPRPLPGDEFARGVREQEFTFVDRPMLAVEESAVDHLVRSGLLRGVGERQQHVARQLVRSRAGVWRVDSRVEGRAVFVGPLDGERYDVLEHATTGDNPYRAGFIALGRLIPLGDGTWLRSPGTLLLSYGDRSPSLARTLAEGLETQRGSLPMPAAVEFTVHQLYGARGLPRTVPPSPSPEDAADAGRDLSLLLRAAGLARPADPSSNPEAARMAARTQNTEVLEYNLDMVLAQYMQAIVQQSQKSRAVREARRRTQRMPKKKGRRR